MSGFGHPCLTFSITQRSTLPPANSYKDGRVQPTSIHTSKFSVSLCSKCMASHYALFFFLRFEIGYGQAYDRSSNQIAVVCSRRIILSDKYCMSIVAPVRSRVWSVGGVDYVQTVSVSTGCVQQYLIDENNNYLRFTLNRIRHRYIHIYVCIYTHTHIYMYLHTYICVCVYIYTHTYMYVSIYIHTHIHRGPG
jgi:hypothetical protein